VQQGKTWSNDLQCWLRFSTSTYSPEHQSQIQLLDCEDFIGDFARDCELNSFKRVAQKPSGNSPEGFRPQINLFGDLLSLPAAADETERAEAGEYACE
jgi:hypothetical protein